MSFSREALKILEKTSRTFYIPISNLPHKLQDAVASAYLCMRAIDEVEDSEILDRHTKIKILQTISFNIQSLTQDTIQNNINLALNPYQNVLPEVSIRIGEWLKLAPQDISPRIWDATATMADRMAYWANNNWQINDRLDLDCYTFSVAGAVGLLLSDLWAWYDGTTTNRTYAIGFGRGLQAVNIVRNRADDLSRGVDFFPPGWTSEDMQQYARTQLHLADLYNNSLTNCPAKDFCQIPLTLAHATLDAIASGKEKLTRTDVLSLIGQQFAIAKLLK